MQALTDDLLDLALSYMEGLDCARAVTVAILLRYDEWDQLDNLELNPSHYSDPATYLRAAGASSFLSKFDRTGTGESNPEVESRTLEKWIWAEKECFKTNQRFDKYLGYGKLSAENSTAERFLLEVRKNIVYLIGREPPAVYDGRFGPGATVSDRSTEVTVLHKMSSQPTFTPNALFHLVPWTGTAWARALSSFSEKNEAAADRWWPKAVRGNVYFTVPKNSRIRRACGKEPSINGYYQLGLGRVMRARLKVRGIDLDMGQDVHRQVACAGSKTDGESWSTIDLSSASDTIAYNLVKLLLPMRWFDHLDALRSPVTLVGDQAYRLEKFSSMGNGFTFELETVIFTAIAMAIVPNALPGWNVFCYGDDIIVPSCNGELVMRALQYCGFTVNVHKTFQVGPFRESCGGDFYNGAAVRPYYLKESLDEPQQIIATANGIRRMALQNGHDPALWHNLRRVWFKLLDRLPSHIRSCRGPTGLGDLCIHDEDQRWNTRWRANCIRYVRVYRPAKYRGVKLNRFHADVLMAGALYGIRPKGTAIPRHDKTKVGIHDELWDLNRILVDRDGVTGYKVGWVPYS